MIADLSSDAQDWAEPESADEIHAIHVIEHLTYERVPKIIAIWRNFLKPGGKFVAEMPCLDKIIVMLQQGRQKDALDGILGKPDIPHMGHKWCWTIREFTWLLECSGFEEVKALQPYYHKPDRDMRVEAIRRD